MSQLDSKNKLIKILKDGTDLPSLPTITSKALQLIGNPRTSMKDIGNVIGSDQAVTSKLLRMVNSAYYGFPRKISTISQALVVVGVEGLRSLIMGLSLQPMFNSKLGKLLWAHSICTAAGAKIITQKYGNVHPEESFVVGLLHDIGRLILSQHFSEEFEYHNFIKFDSIKVLAKEREVFGMDHSEIGATLALKWNLPTKIVDAIKYHHKPNMLPQDQVALVVSFADSLALYLSDLELAKIPDQVNIENYVNKEHMLKLKIKEIPDQLIDDLKSKTRDLMEVFGQN